LLPFDAEKVTEWKVDKAVGNVKNDTPPLLRTDNVVQLQRLLTNEELIRSQDVDDAGEFDGTSDRKLRRLDKKQKAETIPT
jgi:hypothetical protein